MRIGIITGEYPPMEGGVGDFTRQLSLALHDQDHEIHILTGQETEPPPTDNQLNVARSIHSWGPQCPLHARRWAQTLALDVVNVQYQAAAYQMKGWINALPALWRRSRGRGRATPPVIVTYHDLLPPYLFPKAGRLRQWSVWQLARYAGGAIVTNRRDLMNLNEALESQTRTGSHITPVKMIPIGSNIAPEPPDDYDRAAWRAALGYRPEHLVVGYFGFMNRSKGIETLIRSLAQLVQRGARAHLLIIGGRTGTSDATNAAYAEEIDALIRELDLQERVKRTGFVTPAQVTASLLGVDVCALPYRDGASLWRGTLHAALAHGCAIVTTTPCTPIPELRDGETVMLVPPEEAGALAQAILAVHTDPARRTTLQRGAAALAQRFTWPHIAAETAALFEEVRERESGQGIGGRD